MLSHLDTSVRQILLGNLLLLVCFLFYLAWWIVAFRPVGAVKGMRSGWLLIPAFLCGIGALVLILQAFLSGHVPNVLLPKNAVLAGGLALYILVLVLTVRLLNRPVTSELFLIIGWAVVMILELNALIGHEALGRPAGLAVLVVLLFITAVCLVCYAFYYQLDSRTGFLDGTVPLVCGAVMTAVISGLALAP